MGGSRAQVNKAHKTRFASKSSRNVHKVSTKGSIFFSKLCYFCLMYVLIISWLRLDKRRIVKPDRNLTKGARAARLQRNKMVIFYYQFNFFCLADS